MLRKSCFNPLNTKLNDLNFHRLEDVSPYRDPQREVGENYSYNYSNLFNLRPDICKSSWCLQAHFVPNNNNSIGW